MIVRKKIEFEVAEKDLDGTHTWNEAMKQGQDGWRLPTKDELNIMYQQKDHIGGFAYAWYWSSSEKSTLYAWKQNFNYGTQDTNYKDYNNRVRFVRDIRDIPPEATECI